MKFVHLKDHEEKGFIESRIFVCFNLLGGAQGWSGGGVGEQ